MEQNTMRTYHTVPASMTREIKMTPDSWLPADRINVDMQYQRPLNMSHVRAITKGFDLNAFGVLLVSERADGTYWVIDGQHRLAAVLSIGDAAFLIPCHIYRGLSVAEEATVFHMQTLRRAITPIDRFKARVFSDDPQALAIDAILRNHGLQVGNAQHGYVTAVAAVERIYTTHGAERLDLVLTLIMAAIDDEPGRVPTSTILYGVNAFLTRYGRSVNQQRLTAAIRTAGVEKIVRSTTAIKELLRESVSNACGRALLAQYNNRLQSNRLPEWDAGNRADMGWKTKRANADRIAPDEQDIPA